ncbi:MAG: YfhO family protein [Oscillospiraceae bacterium]|jgi:uncharacterized membrane protein YfhO|nr:YfhO family protein [Oscillospiraceae bacterium]
MPKRIGAPAPNAWRALSYALCFLVPAGLMLAAYARLGVHPFGAASLLITDMDSQYSEFYAGLRYMLSGETSPLFSWHMALGNNAWGLFTYYLSSPLSFVPLLFSDPDLPTGLLAMTLLKIGLCGLSFGVFANRIGGVRMSEKGFWAVLPGLAAAYALMSYAVVYAMMPMWLDTAALLPLMALGVERLLRDGRRLTLIAAMAAAVWCNYYTAWMAVVFLSLYFVWRLFMTAPGGPGLAWRLGAKAGQFALCGLSAAGLGAVVLLPAYFALRGGRAGSGSLNFSLLSPARLGGKLLNGVFDGFRYETETAPALYCGAAVVVLCVCWFFLRGVSRREKLVTLGMVAAVALCFVLPPLNGLFHLFQPPNWFPYRYAFVGAFFLAALAAFSLSRLKGPIHWGLLAAALFWGVIVLFLPTPLRAQNRVALTLALAAVSAGLLFWRSRGGPAARWALPLLAVLLCADMFLNADTLLRALNADTSFRPYAEWADYRTSVAPSVEALRAADGGFYRVEKDFQRSYNDAVGLGYNGLAHYSSAYKQSTNDFLRRLGFQQGWFWSSGKGGTLVSDALLGVKYRLSQDRQPPGMTPVLSAGTVTAYRNEYALPVAFMADENLPLAPDHPADPFAAQEELTRDLAPAARALFVPVTPAAEAFGLDTRQNGYYQNGTADARVVYTAVTPTAGPLYLYLNTAQSFSDLEVYVGETYLAATTDENGVNYLLCVGDYPPGQTVTVTLRVRGAALWPDGYLWAQLDTAALADVADTLRPGGLTATKTAANGLSGTVTAAADGLLFTSIPYDEGWRVYADGRPLPTEAYDGALLCVRLPAGTHEMTFRYTPPGLLPGGAAALATLLAWGLGLLLKRRGKKVAR